MTTTIEDLVSTAPERLPFAPGQHIRAFELQRSAGNLLLYSVRSLDHGNHAAERWYLNHWHEALFAPAALPAPLHVHVSDRSAVDERTSVTEAFSERHVLGGDFEVIPAPGHTPGATAYLWDSGARRYLFTGDTIYIDSGEWVAAVLESSDRTAYLESLALLRELDFDVLVPWAASADGDWLAATSPADTRRRIDDIIRRVRRGESR